MPEFPKPTRRTTLTQFCETLVPAWSALLADPALKDSPALHVDITVDDETQHLILHAQGPRHGQGASQTPHLRVTCDKAAWRTAMESLVSLGIEHLEKRHEKARATLLLLQPQAQASLTAVMQNPGTLEFTFVDDAGDAAVYTFRLGTGVGPVTKIKLDDKRLHALVSGHAKLPQVLSSVDIAGDAGYVTRLVQLVLQG